MRPLTHLASLLLATAVFACGGDSTSPTASIAGSWNLQTVDGSSLPFILAQTGGNKQELTGGVLTLSAASSSAGSYTITLTERVTVNGQVTTSSGSDAGTYSLNGTAVTLTSNSGAGSFNGSWSGNSLTLTDLGVALVFGR